MLSLALAEDEIVGEKNIFFSSIEVHASRRRRRRREEQMYGKRKEIDRKIALVSREEKAIKMQY